MSETDSGPAVTMSRRQLKACMSDSDPLPIVRTAEEQRSLDAARRRLRSDLHKRLTKLSRDRASADDGA